ncbi:hypothetical protein M406DRAFT_257891 [Cryphonectria parasitica EP155]|uniref:Phosphatidic acid phosphatase type 2/haloperoxidase domain-containing protein n=1 Tax=Cryphonectria parasitica (strain ATCC 38755 / EP155) TaxID=660469 RepID=A0A9P4Y2A8_CRYP1|nr:uncharacterized protein M406DRAFT_257891 [Cryphonectria parasitica EP155]KAF3765682.1 hypothetical protein M406DRAFT_257891 [Cryphonectria parasitica EP155]
MHRRPRGSSSGSEQQTQARDAPLRISVADDDGLKDEFPVSANGHVEPKEGEKKEVIDAGLRSLDHYKRAMPAWRYQLRQRVLPLVRWETPYLAYFQDTMRTPALDSYFAITANLGTHTFFMIGLPILFWCGFPSFGRGLVHILAEGVFFSGFIKDMLSLPRPLSPPLHRITMSGSVALEYGFPSTHSANAVSVAVYALLLLRSPDCAFSATTKILLESLGYFYAASIIIGRLYCGMHGFADVIFGSLLGAVISLIEFYHAPAFEEYLHASGWIAPFTVALLIIILVRVHPEPADDCPCFDDSVAFSGVMIGLEIASWRNGPDSLTEPFPSLSWPMTIARIVFGVLTIIAWRESMKPALLKTLPQLFRFIEKLGVSLPRRFFVPASEYKNIPNLLKLRTDNVLPTMSDFPHFVKTLRAPARGRSVSVGPQSAADAYEALAYREKRRRESIGSNGSFNKGSHVDLRESGEDHAGHSPPQYASAGKSTALADYEQQMGQGRVILTRSRTDRSPSPATPMVVEESEDMDQEGVELFALRDEQDELGEREMFERLVKPRVRYDVEVVTKLVVYTGIAWLAVEGIPSMHELVGLGVRHLHAG